MSKPSFDNASGGALPSPPKSPSHSDQAPPPGALDGQAPRSGGGHMPAEEFRRAGHALIDWIAHYLENARTYPVLPDVQPGEFTDRLPASGPEAGEPMERILADFHALILPAITHWNHPRFMAYFSVSASGPGILGELLTAALNINGMLWKTGPAVTELEQVALGWLRQWLGLPEEFFGIIYDTASVSTLHAIAAAREAKAPECRREGAPRGLVLYCSEQAHSSVEKGAIALGIGQNYVRKISVDERFRMIPEHLAEAIRADEAAGRRPFCVVATVGTTSTTSVDPVAEIGAIARRHGLWLHVDAAYGGAAALVDGCRHYFDGVAEADSVVMNPHKWLFTPIDCSAFYTRRPEILAQAFSLLPEYLRTAEHPRALNYMDYGVPLGRRFRALKLWFVLRYYGREGIARILASHIRWAQELAAAIASHPDFELMAPVPMSLVCFRHRSGDERNMELLERVNRTGQAYLSHTRLQGKYTLRLAIGNVGMTREDVFAVWELIQREAARQP